ncbi:MAG: ATP-binding protein [Clostridiales bacterium]|nr:ATP-binding protein [Clostridiales bacterium]
MDKAGISFVCTKEFLSNSYYSYESMLLPVFINVVNNAIYWVGFGDEKKIEIDVQEDKTLIMNSGPQMSHTELSKCFEIFYTKKPSGRGIGLYLAKRNLNAIDLDIYASNDPKLNRLGGACFVILAINEDNGEK